MTLDEFNIDLNRHSEDDFELHFDLDHTFFALKEHSIFSNGTLGVDVQVHRLDRTVNLHYSINGNVKESCERCLKPITIAIASRGLEVYKLTSNPALVGQENHLPEHTPVISLYDLLYQEICLSAPNRLICENAEEDQLCEYPDQEAPEQGTDPRWDKLKDLINK